MQPWLNYRHRLGGESVRIASYGMYNFSLIKVNRPILIAKEFNNKCIVDDFLPLRIF
jgi:hypothetical protein